MNTDKLRFLKNEFPALLEKLNGSETPKWGIMNAQQMIEHMSDSFRQGNGKAPKPLHTAVEHVPAYQNFLMSEKEFKPETKNPTLPAQPEPVKNKDIPSAINELKGEIAAFEAYFQQPERIVTNPIFGDLNYEGWIQLLYKHAVHHLKQFDLL